MKNNCQQHLEESKQQLKTNGLKVTPARLSLLDIFKHTKRPLSIKEIAVHLGKSNVDLVTIYRNVEALENLGFIKQIRFQDRQAYYELSGDHHHHLICEGCGKITDIKNCSIPVLSEDLLKNSGFATIDRHSLEFFGVCNSCEQK